MGSPVFSLILSFKGTTDRGLFCLFAEFPCVHLYLNDTIKDNKGLFSCCFYQRIRFYGTREKTRAPVVILISFSILSLSRLLRTR
jgi:hypothetical protein